MLYELKQGSAGYDFLSFDVRASSPNSSPAVARSVSEFRECYDRKPLLKKWRPPHVVIHRDELRTDIYSIGSSFAVNEKSKKTLSNLIGPYVEFLPVIVTGEKDQDEIGEPKPIAKPQTLYLINPLVEVELAKGSISHKMAYRHVTRYVFSSDQLLDLPIFRAKEDLCILVSKFFCEVIEKNKLRGLQFRDEFLWHPSTGRGSTPVVPISSKTIVQSKKLVEPPELISEDELSSVKQMTQGRWQKTLDLWKWVCDATQAREGNVDQKLKVSKPINERQLATLRKKVGGQLPLEFEQVLTQYASKVNLSWDIEAAESHEEYECLGCYENPWDATILPSLAEVAEKHRKCGIAYFESAFDHRLPFIDVGTGDYVAFDMQRGTKQCPIVYLSHDNDESHNRVLGRNFVEFILRWSSVGCIGPDYLQPFYDKRKNQINCHGRSAQRWRKFMASGS